jgi:sulfatase maturation enzyme AslB (radical SAM superfamily)
VSIDGQRAEHDARRKPATYDRILEHIKGHQITVHCTITRQQTAPGYLETFTDFWCAQPDIKRIWFSLYTPQKGEVSDERLRPEDRRRVVASLAALHERHPKLMDMRPDLLAQFLTPPRNPSECVFAATTACVSADLKRVIEPCQFGGTPECTDCGCMATAGIEAITQRRIGGVPIRAIYRTSSRIGQRARKSRVARLARAEV